MRTHIQAQAHTCKCTHIVLPLIEVGDLGTVCVGTAFPCMLMFSCTHIHTHACTAGLALHRTRIQLISCFTHFTRILDPACAHTHVHTLVHTHCMLVSVSMPSTFSSSSSSAFLVDCLWIFELSRERGFIFNRFSGHADGERRGPGKIGGWR